MKTAEKKVEVYYDAFSTTNMTALVQEMEKRNMKEYDITVKPISGGERYIIHKPMEHQRVDHHWKRGIETLPDYTPFLKSDIKSVLVTGSKNRKDDGVYNRTWFGWQKANPESELVVKIIIFCLAFTALAFIIGKIFG